MKDILSGLNRLFDNRVRLGIMSVLMVNETVDFSTFKELLNVTDGNLASHIKVLEKEGVVAAIKQFIDNKPNTSYTVTKLGQRLFEEHINALERLINPS